MKRAKTTAQRAQGLQALGFCTPVFSATFVAAEGADLPAGIAESLRSFFSMDEGGAVLSAVDFVISDSADGASADGFVSVAGAAFVSAGASLVAAGAAAFSSVLAAGSVAIGFAAESDDAGASALVAGAAGWAQVIAEFAMSAVATTAAQVNHR